MLDLLKNVDKTMLWKLVALHVIVITVSNGLVNIPVEIFGVKLTWAAFTFPLVVIATDLVLAEGAPQSVALRIGFASATAYAIGTLLDVYVFQWLRENYSAWWLAPAVSTVVANIIDTYAFFFTAFSGSANEYMAANWMEIAGSQTILKIFVGLIIFLPAYGVLLNQLQKKYKLK